MIANNIISALTIFPEAKSHIKYSSSYPLFSYLLVKIAWI